MHNGSRFLKPAVLSAAVALGLGIAAIPAQALFADGVNIDTAFPDKEFRQYVKDEFDSNNDGSLSQTEIDAVKRVNVCDLGVTDLTGIGVFTKAEEIWCSGGGGPKSLDFSKNTELQRLYCGDNANLTSLNISGCTKLTLLDCCNSGISKLDVSKMPDLTKLVCYGTKLSSLDVSKNTNLTYLDCSESDITEVDVANCPGLIKAMTDSDYYGEGYFSRYYHCEDNNYYLGIPLNAIAGIPLIEKYFPDSYFRDYLREGTPNGNYPAADTDGDDFLTVSELKAVKKINSGEIGIKSIKGIEYFINLELLWGGMSEIPEYDLSRNVNLVELHLGSNHSFKTVDLSKCTKLEILDCSESSLNNIDLSNNLELKEVNLFDTDIWSVNIAKNTKLEKFDCSWTHVSKLDIPGCPNLMTAYEKGTKNEMPDVMVYDYQKKYKLAVPDDCEFGIPIDSYHFPDVCFQELLFLNYEQDEYFFSLEELKDITKIEVVEGLDYQDIDSIEGIGYFPELTYLSAENLELTDIDLSKNTKLDHLNVQGNPITKIDLSQNTKLNVLQINGTTLSELDLSKNTELYIVSCCNNDYITGLDLSKNTKLEELYCYNCPIKRLDISKNKDLRVLDIMNDPVSEIVIYNNPKLVKAFTQGEFYDYDFYVGYDYGKSDIEIKYKDPITNYSYDLVISRDTKVIAVSPTPTPKPTTVPTKTPTKAPTKGPDKMPTIKPSKKVSITLNKNSAQIKCGGSVQLKALVTGTTEKVTWKSSNIKVAQVDKTGKVVGVQAGTAVITASVAGKSASCKVTVLYKDVSGKKDFWFEPTNYLTAKGVVKGYDNQTSFKPDAECTRAQMVTFLWRLQGEPAPKAKTCKFKDVKSGDYYFKPVLWAVEKGITTGVSKTKFNPKGVCTRAQTVTFLWRMANKPTIKGAKNPFSDVKKSDYFYNPVIWASAKKIVAGYDNGTFKPQGKCLRRQMVTFLYKYDKFVNNK